MLTKDKIFNLLNYPEKINTAIIEGKEVKIKVYGEESNYNRMAMISHFLHNTDLLKGKEKETAIEYMRDYISAIHPEYDEEYTSMVCENAVQLGLFQDLFDVPFPAPQKPKFTFIDLFAGIGGIRIPFGELDGK